MMDAATAMFTLAANEENLWVLYPMMQTDKCTSIKSEDIIRINWVDAAIGTRFLFLVL